MRINRWSLGLLLVMPMGIAVAARPQEDSLAAAARHARESNKPASQKVWTNEDIPQTPGAVSVVGSEPPATAPASPSTAPAATPDTDEKPADQSTKRAFIQSGLDAAKDQLKTIMTDLDILTRKHALDSQTYYGKPNYSSDTAGAAQLQSEQDQIDATKQQVDQAQQKVNDLQAQLDALSSDQPAASGSANTPTKSSPSDQSTSPSSDSGSGASGHAGTTPKTPGF